MEKESGESTGTVVRPPFEDIRLPVGRFPGLNPALIGRNPDGTRIKDVPGSAVRGTIRNFKQPRRVA